MLKMQAFLVNGKSVVRREGLVFRTVTVFSAIIPVFVVVGVVSGLGLSEETAEFLMGTITVDRFTIFVHRKTRLTDRIIRREPLGRLWSAVL